MPRINIPESDYEKLGRLLVQAWIKPATRLALINDPIGTMKGVDIDVSKVVDNHVRVVAIEDTLTTKHIIIPVDPRVETGDLDVIMKIESEEGKINALGEGAVAGCR